MSMHRIMLVAATAAVATTASHAGNSAAFYEMSADGEVQIAPDGHVSDYQVKDNLPSAIASLVKRNVMSWQFEPIVVDGKPVVAKTAMHLSLRAEPVPERKDEFSVRIASIFFGTPMRRGASKPPQYPRDAAHARLGAQVLLSARLDENGNIAEIYPYQTSLDAHARNEKEAERWRHQFEDAALAAARTWQYDLAEIVADKKIGAYVLIPVKFSVSPSSATRRSRWTGYEPGPIHPSPWNNADEAAVAQLDENDVISTSSRFHLKDDVVGKIL